MKRSATAGMLLGAALLVPPAYCQGDFVPRIEQVDLSIARFIATRELAGFAESGSIFFLWGFVDLWDSPEPFDPFVDVAGELDVILVTMVVYDADLADVEDPNSTNEDIEFFYRVRAFALTLGPPEPPPLYGATNLYLSQGSGVPAPEDVYGPFRVFLSFVLQVPRFVGASQDHLRGLIDYDVAWDVVVRVSNDESPDEETGEFDQTFFPLYAQESALLVAPNPPPVADAGGDQTVQVGATVKLDASRSFDGTNVGFDALDPDILEKDELHYVWEWMDGPERVDPEPDPDVPAGLAAGQWPITVVTLEVANTDAKPYYIYRVTVDDGVNSPPSTAEVRIRVIPKVRENRAPTALIADANGQIVSSRTVSVRIGDEISLSAQLSSDPDGDPLTYHWRQTNELGGILMPDEVLREFQPLSGITDCDISWMAVNVGTFYFNLLVTDQPPEGLYPLSASATVTIDVSEAAAAGEVTGRASEIAPAEDSGDEQQSAASGQPALPAVCGSGSLLSLALTPLGLWLVRGRRR